ncbi:MAG: hypothetical protein FH749_07815 [Firmicutes bacterium]|nr:hypothetical protein [Bacillota bacterium]
MQNLSSSQREHLENVGALGVTITVDPTEGSQVIIETGDLIQNSLSIERGWTSSDSLEIGCAYTSELKFTLDNQDGQWNSIRWEGARLTVVLDIGGEPLQTGIFTVDERPGKLTTMQIRALDDMARFNRPYNSTLPFPATLQQILVDACARCNVTLYTQSFDNDDYVVTQKPEGDDFTYHHIVSWVAELAGCNAWIDHLGRLQLSWYGDNQSDDLEIGPEDRFDYELAEEDVEITGIVYRAPAEGDEEDIDYVAGTDDYALVIEDNPLLQENYEAILSALYNKIGGFKYRPYSFSVLGYPHLWPGDVITKLIDADGDELSSVITNHTYTLNGNSQIDGKGETETVRGYATGAPFTSSQKRVLQTVAHVEAERQASAVEQTTLQLNQLMANSLGYYETIVPQESGAAIKYIHDVAELENSQNIWKYSADGFAWTDQGWQGGNPSWQYGVTVGGGMVAKTLAVTGIHADWIQVGSAGPYITGQIANAEQSAKDFAEQEAGAAFSSAQALLNSLADGDLPGGSFINGREIYSPVIYGLTIAGMNGMFDQLWAGDTQGAHLHMGDDGDLPFLTMYDGEGVAVTEFNPSGLLMWERGAIRFPYFGSAERAEIRTLNTANRQVLMLKGNAGSGVSPDSGGVNIYGPDDTTNPGQTILYGGGSVALRVLDNQNVEIRGRLDMSGNSIDNIGYLNGEGSLNMRLDRSDYIFMREGTASPTIRFWPGSGDVQFAGDLAVGDMELNSNRSIILPYWNETDMAASLRVVRTTGRRYVMLHASEWGSGGSYMYLYHGDDPNNPGQIRMYSSGGWTEIHHPDRSVEFNSGIGLGRSAYPGYSIDANSMIRGRGAGLFNSYVQADGGFRYGSYQGVTNTSAVFLRNLQGGYWTVDVRGGIITRMQAAG